MSNQENFQPSFYAVIPANVRYDKNLEPNAKLLYGEITALCNREGFCWASNNYFADLYDVDKRTVQRWIASLIESSHITIEVIQEGIQTKRKIFITSEIKNNITERQKCRTGTTNLSPPQDKNVTYNNTSNITSNNLPPLSSKKSGVPKEIDKKEEEDFSFLSIYQLSPKQIKDLKDFPSEKVKESMELAWKDRKIKSKVGWALTRLKNPENFNTPIEEKFTQNQLLAFNHNEFLKKYLSPEVYKENIRTIAEEKYFVVGYYYVGKKKVDEKLSIHDQKSEKQLLEDIKESIQKWKKI